MIKNQLGKRNLSVFAKVELALELQEIIAKQARRNQTRGVSLKLDEGIDTGSVLAEIASCSRATFLQSKKMFTSSL
jgi:hypothetical protein